MTEAQLQLQVCDYLRLQYPNVVFRSDVAAGLKLTMGQASRHKRLQSSRAYPDLFIAQPRYDWSGLYLELKKPGVKLYKADGSLYADAHVHEQDAMLQRLRELGYRAEFAVGFEEARTIIDAYLTTKAEPDDQS